MEPAIEARGLTHEYPGGTAVLRDVTIAIEAGERVAVVGTNRSRGSTLQYVFNGLIEPAVGTVGYVGGAVDAEAVRDRLGVLLQDPDDYLFNTTVRENTGYGPAQLGMSWQAATQRAAHFAAGLGLESLSDRPPLRLSGNEKQRAAITSVPTFEPTVLLLDGPFGAVDTSHRERVLELVTGHGGAVVLFTPPMNAVPEIVDRVLVVGQDGSMAASGSVRDVLTDTILLRDNGPRPPATVQSFEGILDVNDVLLAVSKA